MSDREKDMNELLTLKRAAEEIGYDEANLRLHIREGRLAADKFGGRDWWIRRRDLHAFDAGRRPAGRPLGALKDDSPDPATERLREYQREYRRRRRAEAKAAGAGKAGQKRSAKKRPRP